MKHPQENCSLCQVVVVLPEGRELWARWASPKTRPALRPQGSGVGRGGSCWVLSSWGQPGLWGRSQPCWDGAGAELELLLWPGFVGSGLVREAVQELSGFPKALGFGILVLLAGLGAARCSQLLVAVFYPPAPAAFHSQREQQNERWAPSARERGWHVQFCKPNGRDFCKALAQTWPRAWWLLWGRYTAQPHAWCPLQPGFAACSCLQLPKQQDHDTSERCLLLRATRWLRASEPLARGEAVRWLLSILSSGLLHFWRCMGWQFAGRCTFCSLLQPGDQLRSLDPGC